MRIVDTTETEMVEDWTMTSEAAVDEHAAAVAVRYSIATKHWSTTLFAFTTTTTTATAIPTTVAPHPPTATQKKAVDAAR